MIRRFIDMEITMARLERDNQRSKVFAAIRATNDLVGQPLTDMGAVNAFVDKVLGRATLIRRYDAMVTIRFEVKDGRGYGWATGNKDYITVPKCQRTTIFTLRAIAYTIGARYRSRMFRRGSRDDLTNRKAAWNGWEYCAILMDLVRYGLGEAEAEVLRDEFKKRGVRWKEPVVRAPLIAEKLKVAQERGRKLAELTKDRRKRVKFMEKYPEAELGSPDEFTDPHWETLYLVSR